MAQPPGGAMRAQVIILLVIAASPFFSGISTAGPLTVGNPSFEEPVLPDDSSLIGVGAPWTYDAGTLVPPPLTENPAGAGAGVAEGEQRIRLRTDSNGSAILIQQTLAATYMPDTVYVFAITPIDFDGG